MEFVDYKCLESLLIEEKDIVMENSSNNYPKELWNYKFTSNGKFDNATKSAIKSVIETSAWETRLNELFTKAIISPKYKKKINEYCEKNGIKINKFEIEVLQVYFRENSKSPENNNMFINITFRMIDRYNCPGFVSIVTPILLDIIKSDMGNEWIVERSEYPTDFIIYRKLNNNEVKTLQDIKNNINIKQNSINENRKATRKLHKEKINETIEQEISNNSEKFYNQSLKDQALEIVKYFTFNSSYYYDKPLLNKKIPKELASIESIKLDSGEKMFKFEYMHPKSFEIYHGKPIQNKLICYAISSKENNYKKLNKVYFIKYEHIVSETFNSYIKAKVTNKK